MSSSGCWRTSMGGGLVHIGEHRRTIYVEPIEEPFEEPSGDPGHEERPIPTEPARTLEPSS